MHINTVFMAFMASKVAQNTSEKLNMTENKANWSFKVDLFVLRV